jgi:hypothetical protein
MSDPEDSTATPTTTTPTTATPPTATPTTATPTTSAPTAAAEKDPDEWVTGDEPMTGPQASYLSTLAQDTGREVPERLSKADASKLIDELQAESGRAK